MNFFKSVIEAPPDSILGLNVSFFADTREQKVNLGAGVYKTSDLKPFILNTVKKAETLLLEKENSKDYLPIDGLPDYVALTKSLIFEDTSRHAAIYGTQTVGGTAALCIGSRFLKELGFNTVYLSDPTWPNHERIFQQAGFKIEDYPYFSPELQGLDFSALLNQVAQMEEHSVIVLQVACHNPTGLDPTQSQWQTLFDAIAKRKLFPFFDFAYQGFGVGIMEDAAPLSLFLRQGGECAVAISHAKNFGIYAERAGALFVVCQDREEAKRVGSQLKVITRGLYSNPPCHGARIVATILGNAELKKHWMAELTAMRLRITEMRQALALGLQAHSSSFDFMLEQKGMFSYTGLSVKEVAHLTDTYGIYMPKDGRINVAGLNTQNLDYVINAIVKTHESI